MDPEQNGTLHERPRSTRESKLRDTLRELLEARGYARKRGEVARAVAVSPSALSQYVSGRAQPSLETLIRLANFFDVSLDYLVFGTDSVRPETIDPGPVASYVDTALTELQRRTADHANMVGRISRILASTVDEAARQAVEELGARRAAGLLDDSDVLALEHYSIHNRIVSKNLKYDLITAVDGTIGEGRYARIVARNLNLGRSYHFLLPSGFQPWDTLVGSYRRILNHRGATDEALDKRCLFRETTEALAVDFSLLTLQTDDLRMSDPLLYENVRHAIGGKGDLGLIHAPSHNLNAFALMDRESREWAARSFDSVWTARVTRPVSAWMQG